MLLQLETGLHLLLHPLPVHPPIHSPVHPPIHSREPSTTRPKGSKDQCLNSTQFDQHSRLTDNCALLSWQQRRHTLPPTLRYYAFKSRTPMQRNTLPPGHTLPQWHQGQNTHAVALSTRSTDANNANVSVADCDQAVIWSGVVWCDLLRPIKCNAAKPWTPVTLHPPLTFSFSKFSARH